MRKLPNFIGAASALLLVATLTGCSSLSVTPAARRAGMIGLGTAAGAGAGYLVNKSAAAAVVGAVSGAALTQLALGDDNSIRQQGFDDGYIQGQSDAIKRQYFLRRALEAQPASATREETVYYVMPGPDATVDGRKLEPHQVAVRVVE